MKKTAKIFAILATLVLIVSALCIFAFAAEGGSTGTVREHKTAISEGKFLWYDADGNNGQGKYTEMNNSAFFSTLTSMQNGDTILLLSDCTATTAAWGNTVSHGATLPASGAKGVYVDLNGYQLSLNYNGNTSGYMIMMAENTDLYFYSSDSAHTASMHAYGYGAKSSEDSKEVLKTGLAFFNPRKNNTNIYIGAVPKAQLITGTLNNWSISYDTTDPVSADNFETYTIGHLFTSFGTSNVTSGSVNLLGGRHYYQAQSLFSIYDGIDVVVDGAEIVSTSGGATFGYVGTDANITVADSKIYTTGNIIFDGYELSEDAANGVEATNIVFKNSYLASTNIATMKRGEPTFENCRFTYSNTLSDNKYETVRTRENISLSNPTASGVSEGNFGIWQIDTADEVDVIFAYATASSDNIAKITWKTPKATNTELWLKGDNIIPTPAAIPASNEVYSYSYGDIAPTSAGNATYTLTARINFTVRANITLYSDFIYNMYIPKKAADSSLFVSARIDTVEYSGAVTKGNSISPELLETRDIAITDTMSETYYVLPTGILATEGDKEYKLVLTAKGYYGETIEHAIDFSIADYARRVNEGNYSAKAKEMVSATLTYIKAARNYFVTSQDPSAALPYPIESNADIAAAMGAASKTQSTIGQNDALLAVTTSPDENFKFIFYIKSDYLNSGKTLSFTYPDFDGVDGYKTDVINKDNATSTIFEGISCYSYDISLRALYIRSRIDIAGSDGISFTYRFANYVYSVYGDGTYELDRLLDTIWAYSAATYNYAADDGSSDTPTVEMTIAGNKVTADSYYILASDGELQAAETVQKAIAAKIGELLTVSTTEIAGKNAIRVSLTEPSIFHDFKASVEGDDLVLAASFKSFIESAVNDFTEQYIRPASTSISFDADFTATAFTDKFYYSDFGITGVDMSAVSIKDISKWYGSNFNTMRESLNNDFFAMREAHEFANLANRHTVYADEGATYYISGTTANGAVQQIVIQTPVNWGNANIVIDDSDIPNRTGVNDTKRKEGSSHVFVVNPYESSFTISDEALLASALGSGLNADSKKIDLGLGYEAMLILTDTTHKVYRRYSYAGGWSGSAMQDLVVVDKNGNIDPTTKLIFDYTNLSQVKVYRTDIPELVIEGGNVTTLASRVNAYAVTSTTYSGKTVYTVSGSGSYQARGLNIQRSNTIVKDMKHKVVGEFTISEQNGTVYATSNGVTYYSVAPQATAPSNGFYAAGQGNNITFYNCEMQGRRNYGLNGTYEISGSTTNNLTFEKCIQTNFYVDKTTGEPSTRSDANSKLSMAGGTCWGAMGSNFCKNMNYIDSVISRYDAHQGLYNGKIIGSTINDIEIVGNGTMIIEDTDIYKFGGSDSGPGAGNSLVYLRDDYASTWNGQIIFKDVRAFFNETETNKLKDGNAQTAYSPAIYYHSYQNWYYGYESHFPNTTLDNVTFHSQLVDHSNYVNNKNESTLLSAAEMGSVYLVGTGSFKGEPNLHLDNTKNKYAIYPIIDLNDDGYIDNSTLFDDDGDGDVYDSRTEKTYIIDKGLGIKITDFGTYNSETKKYNYDQNVLRYGITTELKTNVNKIVPPKTIAILNDSVGYNYKSAFDYYKSAAGCNTGFFDDTYIFKGTSSGGNITITETINQGKGEIVGDKYYIKDEDTPIVPYD